MKKSVAVIASCAAAVALAVSCTAIVGCSSSTPANSKNDSANVGTSSKNTGKGGEGEKGTDKRGSSNRELSGSKMEWGWEDDVEMTVWLESHAKWKGRADDGDVLAVSRNSNVYVVGIVDGHPIGVVTVQDSSALKELDQILSDISDLSVKEALKAVKKGFSEDADSGNADYARGLIWDVKEDLETS